MRILITGGAGFLGSFLAERFSEEKNQVVVVDNLNRRGTESNLPRFRSRGIPFVFGDVSQPNCFSESLGSYDFCVALAGEPSVGRGQDDSAVVDRDILGSANTFRFAKRHCGGLIFFSSSRVYSTKALRELPLQEMAMRLTPQMASCVPGFSSSGIGENFSTASPRTFYGTGKICAESILAEYGMGLDYIINRSGVVCGPGQFGREDQGVYGYWIAAHHFGRELFFRGFGGKGLQVRDLLHPEDLFQLVKKQMLHMKSQRGEIFNIGGGMENSISLREWTSLAEKIVGKQLQIKAKEKTDEYDIPFFVADIRKTQTAFDWSPAIRPQKIAEDFFSWLLSRESELKEFF